MSQIIKIAPGREICVSRSTIPLCADVTIVSPGLPSFEASLYQSFYDTPQDYETAIQRTVEAAQTMLSALAGLTTPRTGIL